LTPLRATGHLPKTLPVFCSRFSPNLTYPFLQLQVRGTALLADTLATHSLRCDSMTVPLLGGTNNFFQGGVPNPLSADLYMWPWKIKDMWKWRRRSGSQNMILLLTLIASSVMT